MKENIIQASTEPFVSVHDFWTILKKNISRDVEEMQQYLPNMDSAKLIWQLLCLAISGWGGWTRAKPSGLV